MGMLAPMLVQLEREIDREIALEARAQQRTERTDLVQEELADDSDSDDDMDNRFLGPMPQIITNDLKSLDEMVSRSSAVHAGSAGRWRGGMPVSSPTTRRPCRGPGSIPGWGIPCRRLHGPSFL